MKKISRLLAVLAVSVTMLGGAATSASAAPSDQDVSWMKVNAQTNLAEIALGTLTLEKGQSAGAKELATMTKADHEAALAKLKPLAEAKGVELPTEPNAEQKATAAKLAATPALDYDLAYAQAQVLGHEKSIAGTETEISNGSDADVLAYAQGYLPVAQMHLTMSEDLVTALGGTVPTDVPAGNGGQAASQSAAGPAVAILVGGLALVWLGMLSLRRRRVDS